MIELLLDHLLDAVGHAHLDVRDIHDQLPALFTLDNQTFSDQIVDQVDHEERIPFRSRVNQRRESGWKPIERKPGRQIAADRFFAEILERQLLALLFYQQFLLDRLEWMPAYDQLGSAVGTDEHE